jgi:peptide/nickel transport system ATP-binding protein
VTTDAAAPAGRHLADRLAVDAAHVDVTYRVRGADRLTVRDVSFQIGPRESFGLVGESGCGKTTMALAIVRYLARNGRVSKGSITVAGQDVESLGKDALRELRARTVSMVYQEPGRALNPSIRVGRQMAEVFEIAGRSKSEAEGRAEDQLRTVQINDPGRVMRAYPHQLSGGMLQRVVIAMALAAQPALLILDEPTTALDATVEAEILELVSALRVEYHTAVLFISHNLAVIAKMCDRVGVMYAGGTRTRWGFSGASRAVASAKTTAAWTRSPASCPHLVRCQPAASSPSGARSPASAASGRRPRCTR